MADYAGAVAAIVAKFEAEWVDGLDPRTRIAKVNENPAAPWPPVDDDQDLAPWVLIEVIGTAANVHAFGTPGSIGYLYLGLIAVHVFVPVGSGTSTGFALAVAAGDIFREKQFYDSTPPSYVRSHAPRVDNGGLGSDDGAWFRVTATIPFEFYYRG